jgi:hypothetical protein
MLPELKVRIVGDTGQLDLALDNVRQKLSRAKVATDKLGNSLKNFGDGASALGKSMLPVSAAIGGVGAALFATANATAKAGNSIDKMSQSAGLSAESLQEMRFAIGQISDVSQDQFDKAMLQLSRRIGEAANGSKSMVEAFEAVGFSQEEIAEGSITTEQAFLALARASGQFASDAEASAVAGKLLGEEAGRLGPILRKNGGDIEALRARAQELGIVLGDDAVAAAAAYTDKMDELGRQTGALRDQIGAAMLPVMVSLAATIQEDVLPALQQMGSFISDAINWFGQLPGPVQEVAGVIAAALGVGGPILIAVGAFAKVLGGLVLATGPIGLFIAAASLAVAAWVTWGDEIKALLADVGAFFTDTFNGMLTLFQNLPEQFRTLALDIFTGLKEGLVNAWEELDIPGLMGEMASSVGGAFKSLLGIESPSTVFYQFGVDIAQGLRNGITDSLGMVKGAVSETSKVTQDTALDMASGVVSAMGTMFKGSKPIAIAQSLINTYQGITEALKLPFPSNIAAAAVVAAKGFAAVASIVSTKPGSGSSPSGASAGGSGAQGGAAPAPVQQREVFINMEGGDDAMFSGKQVRSLIRAINDELDGGMRIATA